MQQREFLSLLFFPNGEREFPSPSVFSLCREGIPLLFLLMMTFLFSPQEQQEVLFFLVSPFPIRGLRTPLSSHHLSPRGEQGFLCLLFSADTHCTTFLLQYFSMGTTFFFTFFFFNLSVCSILSYKNMNPDIHFKFGYWQL